MESRQDTLASWIVWRSEMRCGWVATARYVDFVMPSENELGSHTAGLFHITHADRGPERVTVGAGGGVADNLAVSIDRLAAPKHRSRVLQDEYDKEALHAQLFLLQERVPAN